MNYAIFKRPSRYIGNEVNTIRKDADINVALCFPDTYEIGMSHIGLKILYAIINNIPYASAERVYAPWIDFESYLRQNNLPLTSLENQRPLKDFDIIGFTLQYELSYTNVLNILDLGKIPIKTTGRMESHPLIIAGGPCTVNPLPLAPFIDAFVIGDGEDIIKEIIDVYKKFKIKENLFSALAQIDGVFVPLIHDTHKQKIKRRITEDLNKAPFPDAPIVPFMTIVHDRVAIEISRGCTKGCRFCQAGMTYRPLRERSLENVLSLSQKSIFNTGYEEISFTSLSIGDYSSLLPLIKNFNKLCAGSYTSISLPSLRVGAINSDILREIKSVRKTGFTIAPEAGTKRLRDVINKNFSHEEYEETLKKLFTENWKNVKLYFMIGLPTETITDINGLIDMAVHTSKKGLEITSRRVNINVGVSAFVPKPHTPFQWIGQNHFRELREKQDYIKKVFKKRDINFKGQHVEHSLLEAVFSRGDIDCSLLLETAWKLGCRFDGWSELFSFDTWLLASEKTGINLYNYASRTLDTDAKLPWDFIDTGITKEFLKSEYQKALQGKITLDCQDVCHGCGLECKERTKIADSGLRIADSEPHKSEIQIPKSKFRKMRVTFSKTGEMRYLSHQELMTAMVRAMKRAKIPVAFSTGFHPHPKISFGPALAVGIEGLNEHFDIEMSSFIDTTHFLIMANSEMPKGLKLLDTYLIPKNEISLNNLFSRYEYEVNIDKALEKHINFFMNMQNYQVSRDNKTVDIRPLVEKAEIKNNTLRLILADTQKAKARLNEILKILFQKTTEEIQTIMIKRVGLYGYNSIECTSSIKDKKLWPGRL